MSDDSFDFPIATFKIGPLGLSLALNKTDGSINVATIREGGQADQNGIELGAVLLKIESTSLANLPMKEVVGLLSEVDRPFKVEYYNSKLHNKAMLEANKKKSKNKKKATKKKATKKKATKKMATKKKATKKKTTKKKTTPKTTTQKKTTKKKKLLTVPASPQHETKENPGNRETKENPSDNPTALFKAGPMGLSLVLNKKTRLITVGSVTPAGQAFFGGMKKNARVYAVAGASVQGMAIKDVINIIKSSARPFRIEYRNDYGMVRRADVEHSQHHDRSHPTCLFEKGPLGLSLSLRDSDGHICVSNVVKGGQAFYNGIQEGAVVYFVDDQDIHNMELNDVVEILKTAHRPFRMEFFNGDNGEMHNAAQDYIEHDTESHNIGLGWWAVHDPVSDHFYYHHENTGQRQWEWPKEVPNAHDIDHNKTVTFGPGPLGLSLAVDVNSHNHLCIAGVTYLGQAHVANLAVGALIQSVGGTSVVDLTLEEAYKVISSTKRPCEFVFSDPEGMHLKSEYRKGHFNKKKSRRWQLASKVYEGISEKVHSLRVQQNAQMHADIHTAQTLKRKSNARNRLSARLGKRQSITGKSFKLARPLMVVPVQKVLNYNQQIKPLNFVQTVKLAAEQNLHVDEATAIQRRASQARREAVAATMKKKIVADQRTAQRLASRLQAKQKNVLRNCELFSELNAAGQDAIIDVMHYEQFQQDDDLCKQGDFATHMYVLMSGQCHVTVHAVQVATLHKLDVFGESALKETNAVRTATVTAAERVEVLSLSRDKLSALTQAGYLDNHCLDKLKQVTQERNSNGAKVMRAYAKEKNILANCNIFKQTSKKSLNCIIELMKFQSYSMGISLITQGHVADQMYVLMKGKCSVHVNGMHVTTLTEMAVFGENALFGTGRKDDNTSLRSSTVTAETDAVEVLSLSRDDLNTLKEIGHLDKQTMQALNAQANDRKRKDAKLLRMKKEEAENKNRLLNHVRGSLTNTRSVRKLHMIGDAAEDVMISDNIGNDKQSQKMKQDVEKLRQHIGGVCKNEQILQGIFKQLDTNKNGTLCPSEFNVLVEKITKKESPPGLIRAMWKTAQKMHKGSHKHDDEELSLDTFRYFVIGAKSAEILIERKTLEV